VKNKRLFIGFIIGVLSAILSWIAYTLYHIFGKPVLPTVKDNLTVDEDADYETAFKKYSEAVMSLDPHSLDDLIDASKDTQPVKIELEPSAKDLEDWAEYIG